MLRCNGKLNMNVPLSFVTPDEHVPAFLVPGLHRNMRLPPVATSLK